MSEQDWAGIVSKLQQDLRREHCQLRLDVRDFRSFQAALDDACKTYAKDGTTRLIRDKITPQLHHLQSFEKAIASSAGKVQAASCLWALSQAVITCTCRFSSRVDATLNQLGGFYETIPRFEAYLELFHDEPSLKYRVRDLYVDFIDFSVVTIQFVNEKPFKHIIKRFVTSKSDRRLQEIQDRFFEHCTSLDKEVERIHIQRSELARRKAQHGSLSMPGAPERSNSRGRLSASNAALKLNGPRKNGRFVGRDDMMGQLHDWFMVDRKLPSEPVSCVLAGMGGIGKTQAALRYRDLYADEYDFIFWVTAETQSKLITSFSLIAHRGKLEDLAGLEDEALVSKSMIWLQETEQSWLLIFDNVETTEETRNEFESYWPTSARKKSAIILTTQQSDFQHMATHCVRVGSLPAEEGAKVLLDSLYADKQPSDEETEAAIALSSDVGGLPLAVAHIGGYISGSGYTLARFRETIQHTYSHVWTADPPSSVRDCEKRLAVVWDFALSLLSPNAYILICILAFLNPDSIPEDMLLGELRQSGGLWDLKYAKAEIFLMDMVHQLAQRCLVSSEDPGTGTPYLTIHRSLQQGLLQKLNGDVLKRSEIFEGVVRIVRRITPSASPIQVPTPKEWPHFNVAVPHIVTLGLAFSLFKPPMQGSLHFARLLYDAGFNMWERERVLDGKQLLDLAERVLTGQGKTGSDRLQADIHAIQGMFVDSSGGLGRDEGLRRRQQAMKLRREAVQAARKRGQSLSKDETILEMNAVNDYAYCLLQSNRYAEAEPLFEDCYAAYQSWGTEKDTPFEYSKYFHNMGTVRMFQGRYNEAVKYMARAVSLTEAAMGDQRTFKVLRDTYMFACILLQAGHEPRAYELHEQVMKERESLSGEHSEITLESYYALGAACDCLGDLKGARKWLLTSVERAPKSKWHKKSVGRAQLHLAKVLTSLNVNLNEAKKYESAGSDMLRSLDSEIPDYIRYCGDPIAIYDSLHGFSEGRFTGRNLLRIIQSGTI